MQCKYLQPPGVGKTLIAKAVSTECNSTLFSVSSSDLGSKYVSESEGLISSLFDEARNRRPSIIFIDEVEWICSARKEGGSSSSGYEGRQKAELLAQMDGTKGDNTQVLVLAATNLPRSLDDAFLRRFDMRIYVPLPDLEARFELFRKKLESNKSEHSLTNDELTELAGRTENYNASIHVSHKLRLVQAARTSMTMMRMLRSGIMKQAKCIHLLRQQPTMTISSVDAATTKMSLLCRSISSESVIRSSNGLVRHRRETGLKWNGLIRADGKRTMSSTRVKRRSEVK